MARRGIDGGGQEATDTRAIALRDLAWFTYGQGDFEQTERVCKEGLRLEGVEHMRDAGGVSIAASLRTILGAVTGLAWRDLEQAKTLFEESLEFSRRIGDTRGTAITLTYLGNVAGEMDDHARANELFEESLALCREPGNRRILARALINMGYTAVLRGDYERATELCEEAVGMLRGDGNATPLRASLDTLGWAALLRGDYERSRAIHQENLNMSREADDRLGVAYALYGLA